MDWAVQEANDVLADQPSTTRGIENKLMVSSPGRSDLLHSSPNPYDTSLVENTARYKCTRYRKTRMHGMDRISTDTCQPRLA